VLLRHSLSTHALPAGQSAVVVQGTAGSQVQDAKMTVQFHGDGGWHFAFRIDFDFDDGTRLSGGADGIELGQGVRERTMEMNGLIKYGRSNPIPQPV
jgi:hypothetical protein